jgi:hypothetical protein
MVVWGILPVKRDVDMGNSGLERLGERHVL